MPPALKTNNTTGDLNRGSFQQTAMQLQASTAVNINRAIPLNISTHGCISEVAERMNSTANLTTTTFHISTNITVAEASNDTYHYVPKPVEYNSNRTTNIPKSNATSYQVITTAVSPANDDRNNINFAIIMYNITHSNNQTAQNISNGLSLAHNLTFNYNSINGAVGQTKKSREYGNDSALFGQQAFRVFGGNRSILKNQANTVASHNATTLLQGTGIGNSSQIRPNLYQNRSQYITQPNSYHNQSQSVPQPNLYRNQSEIIRLFSLGQSANNSNSTTNQPYNIFNYGPTVEPLASRKPAYPTQSPTESTSSSNYITTPSPTGEFCNRIHQ